MKSLYKLAQSMGNIRATKTNPDQVTYSIFSRGGRNQACVFCIGANVRKKMRWIEGDRIDIMYDEDMAEGQLVRCRDGGWQLTDFSKDDSPCRVRVGYRKEFGLPLTEEKVDLAVELTENTIAFAFPVKFRKPKVTAPVTFTAGKGK